ncbi:MAG TPA: nickel-dependent hydrogenase large subunit [Syntrophobacteraceae bacterium]|nr:nickel-dependent hydrogenase large subunit [Syntrophobacteraceae bacterium]
MSQILLDPITRIEGHYKVEALVDNGIVKEAKTTGTLFRGIELILQGRDPRDAQQITQRICGVCPTSHAMAATFNLDSAFGIADKIPDNGRILRNLILGAAHLSDHVLHFYHLAALDYVDVTKVAAYDGADPVLNSVKAFIGRGELGPFVPRMEGDYRFPAAVDQVLVGHYVQALEVRRKGQEMMAIFSGRVPHNPAVVPGGVTETPTVDKIASFLWKLNDIKDFIDNVYIPDVFAVAKTYGDYFEIGRGCANFLSYGNYDLDGTNPDYLTRNRLMKSGIVSSDLKFQPVDASKIAEYVANSWYENSTTGLKPAEGKTVPTENWGKGYTWVKAPRYDGKVCEVGPLARVLASYVSGQPAVKALVDSALSQAGAQPQALFSVLGRHLARALCAKVLADSMGDWLLQLKPGEPVYVPYEIPDESSGMGLIDGARGALGHWIEIKNKRISRYQCVVPSTWNMSPKDDQGQPGPLEQALIGTKVKDEANPFELVRIVRSYDPCLACAIHVMTPKGRTLAKFRVG